VSEAISRKPLPTAPSARFRRRPFIETLGERLRAAAPVAPAARARLKQLYHAALMLSTGGRGLRSELPGGEVIRALPAHRQLAWNPGVYAAFRAAVGPGTTALDVGANVGAYALLLGLWAGGRGRVYAFEPAPDAHAGLVAHIALNRLGDVVRPVAAAVGDRESHAEMAISHTAGESRLVAPGERRGTVATVPVVTIDGFCAREGVVPGFIKIDVEGWELAALRGARRTIAAGGRSLALFVEMHPSIWPALGVSRSDLCAELDAQGLAVEALEPGVDPWAVEGVATRLVPRRS
jgi:FkbM family methyltransferase